MRASLDVYRRSWLAIAGVAVAGVGMIGYVGGRMTRDSSFVTVERVSVYLVLLGFVLFAMLVFIRSANRADSLMPRLFAATIVLWGIDLVLFPFERINAIPLALLGAAAVVFLAAAWKTMCAPEFWLGVKGAGPVERNENQ